MFGIAWTWHNCRGGGGQRGIPSRVPVVNDGLSRKKCLFTCVAKLQRREDGGGGGAGVYVRWGGGGVTSGVGGIGLTPGRVDPDS